MHPIGQFCSLLDAATACDTPLEFYLTESDLHCFLSLPYANQRMYANASTVMNMNQLFNLYIRCLIRNLLCKSVQISQLLWKYVHMIQSTVGKEHHDSAAKLHIIEIIMKKHKKVRTDPNAKEWYRMIWEFC